MTTIGCSRCQGTVEVIADPCRACRGDGRRMEDRDFMVEVPAGVDDGSTLRLAGRGPAGPRGGPNGSLFVHLVVEPDERFERAGDDLHTTLHIGMAQAALGTSVEVETLEEPRQIAVAQGTQTGTVVRIRGLGVPHLRGRGRGDLYVHLAVDTPTELSPRQRELLAELAAERGEEVHGHDGVLSRIRSALG
jgi:molecular chaperone DnaJ